MCIHQLQFVYVITFLGVPGHPRRDIDLEPPAMLPNHPHDPPNTRLRASTVDVFNRPLRRTQSQPIPNQTNTNQVLMGGNGENENIQIPRPVSQPLVNLDGYTTPLYVRQMHPIWINQDEKGNASANNTVPQATVQRRNTEVGIPNADPILMTQNISPPPFVTQRDPPTVNRKNVKCRNTQKIPQLPRTCNQEKPPVNNANQQLAKMLRTRQAKKNADKPQMDSNHGNMGHSSTNEVSSSHDQGQCVDDPNTQFGHLFRRRVSNTNSRIPSTAPPQTNATSYVRENQQQPKQFEPIAGPSHRNQMQPTYVRPSTSNEVVDGSGSSLPHYRYVLQHVGGNSHEEVKALQIGGGCNPLEPRHEESIATVCYQSSDDSITFPCRPPDTRGNSLILEQLREMGEKVDGITTQMLTRKTDLEQQKRMLNRREKQLQDEEEQRLLDESLLRQHREACKANNYKFFSIENKLFGGLCKYNVF